MNLSDSTCTRDEHDLIDAAVDGVLSAELAQHLLKCPPCRDTYDSFSQTREALQGAFLKHPSPPAESAMENARRSGGRSDRFPSWYLLASSVASVALVLIAAIGVGSERASAMNVAAEEGAVLEHVGPQHVRIEEGTSTFRMGKEIGVVETPSGPLRCAECEFTVEVVCANGDFPASVQGILVQVTVARGEVGSTLGGGFRMVLPGDTVTLYN